MENENFVPPAPSLPPLSPTPVPPFTPPTPTITPPPFTPAPLPTNHHWGRKLLSFLVLIISLGIIGGGVLAYFTIFESPQSAIAKSLNLIAKANSFRQEMLFKSTMGEATISTDTETDSAGKRRVAMVINGKSQGFSVGAEIRFLDEVLYGRVNEFPLLAMMFSSANTNPIGRWYQVSIEELLQYAEKQGAKPADITKAREQINKFSQSDSISAINQLVESGVFAFGKRGSLVRVDGEWSLQYQVAVDKEKLKTLADSSTPLQSFPTEGFQALNFEPIIITTSLFGHKLKKIEGGLKVSGLDSATFTITYRDVGGSIKVEKPEGATPLLDLIDQAVNEASEARGNASSARFIASLSSLRANAELYYDINKSSYTNLCTKDEFTLKILKEIENTFEKPICRASSKAFIVIGKTGEDDFWCIDSLGNFVAIDETKIPKTGYVCKL